MKEIDFRHDILPLKDKIFRLALRITLNRPEAEDITQDTLIKVWNNRGEAGKLRSIEAYSLTVCRNLSLDYLRRRETQSLSLTDEAESAFFAPDSAPSAQERLERNERLAAIRRLFNALPEQQRTAMQLVDIEELSYARAAEAMNLAESNFKVLLHRARKAVKQQIQKENPHGL